MAHVTLKIVLYAATDGDLERHAVREHSRLHGLAMAANRGRHGVVAVTARSRPAPSPGLCRAELPTAPSPRSNSRGEADHAVKMCSRSVSPVVKTSLRRSCVGCSMLAVSVRLAELGHRSIDLDQKSGGKVYVHLKTRLKESVSLD